MVKKSVFDHHAYMIKALRQARRAAVVEEVPVGAVVVASDGTVLSRAFNQSEGKKTQVAHAEVMAIAKAGAKAGDWRLEGCWLYVTLEPCAMCFHLILLSRMKGLVFATKSPLFGYRLDRFNTLSLYKDGCFPLEVVEGVEAEQAAQLLREFFKKRRKGSG